ncbi:interleukin-1 beta [Halichoerus grypus]|uniref:Interleukin-1 beta n=2 Tax=Phocinae TaxID=3410118 RepID=IL1B_PHOVR|nr:interleukin-1 beta [Phoca vitulina]XP_035959679.1 interleukin-1 beta [Halichoerus grypus]Q2HZH0.1 RecName: Full=Interleukin-1 beta; Short=IL-1 beta; Flags: Precursor [Pusa hispida]Q6PUD2.1 RecName: Full=Interleukin-1 beta; Short=IL-1 beta; Flags: Precursor [Phoca vitulina richardii]AAS91558.1 interleukin-1 beta precursor [Phoca vitulina richardii]ABC87314.1 interleukin-1 beta [Pusa hispida]
MATVPEPTSEMMSYYYSDNENDLFFEADGPRKMKCCFQDLNNSSLKDEGIQLHISHQLQNKSLRHFVSVVVALEKLKKISLPCSQPLQDDDLKNVFCCIFEEEPIVCEVYDDDAFVCDAPLQSLDCKFRDKNQKSLVLYNSYELRALHLNGSSVNQQAVFRMSFLQGDENSNKIPVALCIKEKNLYLSCVMKDGKPTLQLEMLDPRVYPKKKMEKRFVFNKTEVKKILEFESSQFPNWYISTSKAEAMPVFLGNTKGGQDITDFTMEFSS